MVDPFVFLMASRGQLFLGRGGRFSHPGGPIGVAQVPGAMRRLPVTVPGALRRVLQIGGPLAATQHFGKPIS